MFDNDYLYCYKSIMDNVIDFPWYRAYESTPLSYAEQKLRQKKLFCKNILEQTRQIIAELNIAKVKPDTLYRVVEEESPSVTRYTDHCWIITQDLITGLRAPKIGSNKPPTEFTSYEGLAITPNNMLFQYGALEDHFKKGMVMHVNGRHLFNEIPDEYIEMGATVSSELIRGLARLGLRAS